MTGDFPIDYLKRLRRATTLRALSLKAHAIRKFTDTEFYEFRCNICGNCTSSPLLAVKNREIPSCFSCGSNKRFRSIVAALSTEIYGEIIPLKNFVRSKEIRGVGFSDADVYARGLSSVFSYENTYYHREPRLDITQIPSEMADTANFVIASDVFEHIPPPADIGFQNIFRMLKAEGVFIFSVPYNTAGATREHFPELFEYKIVTKKRKRVLINRTREGRIEHFDDLTFHGGPGSTLEMRVYSRDSLICDIRKAGFTEIKVWEHSIPEMGILNAINDSSFVFSMRKGLSSDNHLTDSTP